MQVRGFIVFYFPIFRLLLPLENFEVCCSGKVGMPTVEQDVDLQCLALPIAFTVKIAKGC